MGSKNIIAAVFAAGAFAVTGLGTGAQASQVVFGNLGSDGSGAIVGSSSPITISDWFAQGFSTGALSTRLFVDQIVLGLEDNGFGAITTSISIWSSSGGNPESPLVTSSSQLVLAGDEAKYTFNFASFELMPSTSYWVVLQQPGVRWNYSGSFQAPSAQNSSLYSYLGTKQTSNSGSSWTDSPLSFLSLSISASESGPEPIPEPGTWAAAALLIGAAAYVRWRRRAQAV